MSSAMAFNLATLLHRAQAMSSDALHRAHAVSSDALHRFQSNVLHPAAAASTAKRDRAQSAIVSIFVPDHAVPVKPDTSNLLQHTTVDTTFLMTRGLSEELVLTIASYLDAASLCRLQQTSRQWRHHIVMHAPTLWQGLACKELGIDTPSSGVMGYLAAYQTVLEREVRHVTHVRAPYEALEHHCLSEPEDHGIIGMFCDVCYFDDARIGQAIATQRFGAMAMVVVQRPRHVQRFRKASNYVGPINFVPLENPHWPSIELPVVEKCGGFLGYAFDLVRMVPGYDHLKPTVIRTILKNIMVFDTVANATAYMSTASTSAPYVTLDSADRPFDLSFASPLRDSLRCLPLDQKLRRLTRLRENTRHAIAYIQYGR
ncbi:hypothetical protein H310_12164 [Aphanomyces invadans]|uniref:F-box domain-containing protein n=1 Tax=Aphanomyces invadans TaxID=157072 RepID=A0A024TJJ3_9STRA|nr:hypothetical protein H310_12164 [Aphanomyces invadans]ETV94164.1 hypothetical protein H310_12164 [Aphanomyces invadans]|eukprot:XP_008877367.1 hypothetical protein H310_12164 [Aphanomyces invadans]